MSDSENKVHVAAFMLAAWGHNKPLAALLARLVRIKPVYVTFFVGLSVYDRVVREVKKQFLPEGEESLRSLIRVVGLAEAPMPFDHGPYREAFAKTYKLLCEGHPVPATPDGAQVFEAIAPPQLMLLDFFLYESMEVIRSISPKCPIYAWQSGSTSAILFLFGPEYLGGTGDLAAKIAAIETDDEKERYEKSQALYRRTNGELITLPGLPPMYDYEFKPQKFVVPIDVAKHCQYVYRMLSESDGSIHCTNHIYEAPALEAWSEWLKGKPSFALGPVETPRHLAKIHDAREPSNVEIEVQAFLDNTLQKHGKNSVVYVSFGTIFWSSEPEKIFTVLDVLIDQKIPFLFSHASPFATVPDELKKKVGDSGLGYMSNWLPQQMILNHEACGWFLSHGGQNSTMESLTAGVPIIFWPFEADQPSNAVIVSMKHNAGYELLEARQDIALQPMYRLGGKAPSGTVEALKKEAIDIFTKARGADGEAKRVNAQKLGKQFADLWEKDGSAWKELQRFADMLN